ncbi:putative transcriptional regulator [Staphylococcus epidermidis]
MNKVTYYRHKEKLSQLELAKMVGVSRQTINLIENNKYNPSLLLCKNIATSLNTTLNDLFWSDINE